MDLLNLTCRYRYDILSLFLWGHKANKPNATLTACMSYHLSPYENHTFFHIKHWSHRKIHTVTECAFEDKTIRLDNDMKIDYNDGLIKKWRNSTAKALELHLFCN